MRKDCPQADVLVFFVVIIAVASCATPIHPIRPGESLPVPAGIARIETVLLAPSNRWYRPRVDNVELVDLDTGRRLDLEIDPDQEWLALTIPAGRYEMARLRIQEGPYRSIADVGLRFEIVAHGITYLGHWRIGVEAPQQGRMLLLSAVADQDEALQQLQVRHRTSTGLVLKLPEPSTIERRLYEVDPYPRYRYFRRHWW